MNKLSIERLSDFERDPSNNFLTRSEMMEVVKELIAVREALKGEQVPVAQIVISKNWPDVNRKVIDYYLEKIQHLPVGTELFTALQKPVVLPKSHYVCGCADRYMSGKEVKAAIEAAGGIVKDGE
ncbi:MAG: hypothetical protein GYA32_13350 [Serratia sp.]|nr:hypothetical protein [Serratia sp. (in: enterobacteria)]